MKTEKIMQFAHEKLIELANKYNDRKDSTDIPFEDRNLAMFCLDIREAYNKMIDREILHEEEEERQKQKK